MINQLQTQFKKIGLNQQEEDADEQLFTRGISMDLLLCSKIDIQHLTCFICERILWKPITCNQPDCFKNFCQKCLLRNSLGIIEGKNQVNIQNTDLIQKQTNCPHCKKQIQKAQLPLIKNLLNQIDLKCFYWEEGCQDTVKYEYFQKHLLNCSYRKIKCQGCKQYFCFQFIKQHISTCHKIIINCEKCFLSIPQMNFKQHKEKQCLQEQLRLKNIHLIKVEDKVEQLSKNIQKYEAIMQKLLKGQSLELRINFQTSFPNNFKFLSKEIILQKASFNNAKQKYDFLHFYIRTSIRTKSMVSTEWRIKIKILKGNLLIGLCSSLNSNSIDFVINKFGQIKKKQLNQNRYHLIRKSKMLFQQNDLLLFRFIPIEKYVLMVNQTRGLETRLEKDQINTLGNQFFTFYSLDTFGDTLQFF